MAGGRPMRDNNEVCPLCGKPGYSYPVPSWNSSYKNTSKNRYLRFIHANRNLPYCYIDPLISKVHALPLQAATEYNRGTNEVKTFQYYPEESRIQDVVKQWKVRKPLTVVIYSFTYLPEELKPEIRKLRKSKKFRLTKQELKWLVEQDGYGYLKEFSKNDIVTFGEEALIVRNKIYQSDSWQGSIKEFSDKNGMFSKIQELRDRNNAIRTTRVNLGRRQTLVPNLT